MRTFAYSIAPIVLAALGSVLATLFCLPTLSTTNLHEAPLPTVPTPSMSSTMRAVLHNAQGSTADELRIGEVDKPQLKADHILIRVKAFGLNRADILQREGRSLPPPTRRTRIARSGAIALTGTHTCTNREHRATVSVCRQVPAASGRVARPGPGVRR